MNDITYVGRHSTVYSVARHDHEHWEFIYCTAGEGAVAFDGRSIPYRTGDVVVIPPGMPHENTSREGFRNIHVTMADPILSLKEPTIIQDTSNGFLLNAFSAAFYHFYSDSRERFALLSCYGSLICYYLIACQQEDDHTSVADDIEHTIIAHLADCDFKLDAYLATLPFSEGYLRKLFQKKYAVTPHQYLTDKRLQMAAEALLSADHIERSISDIALQCGFRDPLYFSRMFKKQHGASPSHFTGRRTSEDLPE